MILDPEKLDDAAYREDMRHRCCTDHFFLAALMGFNGFVERIHGPVFRHLYFPKNNKVSIPEQHHIKKRMHLDPRGSYKTTAGRVDSLQWILAHPEKVTILNESATQDLAREISLGTANYLCRYKIQTPLLRLFPELVVEKWPFHNGAEKWSVPTHDMIDLDSTLAYTSPKSTQSGWHPWVINPDDMVETLNSGIDAKDEIRKKVINTYNTNKNTLRGGGYINVRGTRYHPFELYGELLGQMDQDDPEASGWKVLIRSALTMKDRSRLVPGEFPAEEDMILNFPELPDLNYAKLKEKFHDYESFMCQQMNDPQGGAVPTFDEQLYNSCLIDEERIPQFGGETFVCWRLPYDGKSNMREASGVAARVIDGKVYILECWQGNYVPSRLAERMVQSYKEHQADSIMLLNTPGSQTMWTHVRNEAMRRNVSLRLEWADWEEDDNRRATEIKGLEPMLKVGRILFALAMKNGSECKKQFVHFGLVEDNGIIECVSKLTRLVPMSQLRANLQDEEIEYQKRAREDALVNSFLQQQGVPIVDEEVKRKAEAHLQAYQKATTWGPPPLPGGLDG